MASRCSAMNADPGRPKYTTTCTACRLRRVRCDRQKPCGTCVRRMISHECDTPLDPTIEEMHTAKGIRQQIERVQRLHDLLSGAHGQDPHEVSGDHRPSLQRISPAPSSRGHALSRSSSSPSKTTIESKSVEHRRSASSGGSERARLGPSSFTSELSRYRSALPCTTPSFGSTTPSRSSSVSSYSGSYVSMSSPSHSTTPFVYDYMDPTKASTSSSFSWTGDGYAADANGTFDAQALTDALSTILPNQTQGTSDGFDNLTVTSFPWSF